MNSWIRIPDNNFLVLFTVCFCLLSFFTVLITVLLKKKNKSAPELMARTVTFWWMLGLFTVAVMLPTFVSFILIGFFSGLSFYEYISFQKNSSGSAAIQNQWILLCLSLIPLTLSLQYTGKLELNLTLMFLFLTLILPSVLVLKNNFENSLFQFGYLASGVLFFIFSLGFAAGLAQKSILVLLYCFFFTEMRDMISYWLGKFLARLGSQNPNSQILKILNHKMAERISPNKSWGVGVLSALLIVLLALSMQSLMPTFATGSISTEFTILWALVIGFLGLMGDLVFSMLKRQFALKDSGQILPGNTGLIDRIDSLVLTIPATYFLFYYFYF